MDFGPNHYVPVLKVKRGEKASLQILAPSLHHRITPLLEIVERKDSSTVQVGDHLDTAFKNLYDSVKQFPRCFLDLREIAADGIAAAAAAFQRAKDEGIAFVPVTGVSRNVDVSSAMANRQLGLALRVTRGDFESGGLQGGVDLFLAKHSLVPEEVDLIVDLGAVDEMIPPGIMALSSLLLREIPHQLRWRTFTVSACAFPNSMGVVQRNSSALVMRSDWIAWRDGLYKNRANIERLPTYSDCAIQHPKGVEDFNPLTMQVSASVRYTLEEDWLLVKGESTRRTPAKTQFPGLAAQLVYGNLGKYYAGPTHCPGCASIKNSADGAPKLGSPEVWRRIGTIHHIKSVIDRLGALTWP